MTCPECGGILQYRDPFTHIIECLGPCGREFTREELDDMPATGPKCSVCLTRTSPGTTHGGLLSASWQWSAKDGWRCRACLDALGVTDEPPPPPDPEVMDAVIEALTERD